ncbi:hypothetical protein CALCODRAFT_325198 [Calocera cornea HHB12733]|uniref:Uncharacterized protein n=1 Tax=Calocera cornea HHB12733 TaxID=1353952 RepID=A0A165F4Q6_9BASI|nr:hypothetical protein CALCODRAFT_325198 [Calocera cornea HHB12733]
MRASVDRVNSESGSRVNVRLRDSEWGPSICWNGCHHAAGRIDQSNTHFKARSGEQQEHLSGIPAKAVRFVIRLQQAFQSPGSKYSQVSTSTYAECRMIPRTTGPGARTIKRYEAKPTRRVGVLEKWTWSKSLDPSVWTFAAEACRAASKPSCASPPSTTISSHQYIFAARQALLGGARTHQFGPQLTAMAVMCSALCQRRIFHDGQGASPMRTAHLRQLRSASSAHYRGVAYP